MYFLQPSQVLQWLSDDLMPWNSTGSVAATTQFFTIWLGLVVTTRQLIWDIATIQLFPEIGYHGERRRETESQFHVGVKMAD